VVVEGWGGFRKSDVVPVGVGGVCLVGVAVVLSSTNPPVAVVGTVVVEREEPPLKEASCRRNGE